MKVFHLGLKRIRKSQAALNIILTTIAILAIVAIGIISTGTYLFFKYRPLILDMTKQRYTVKKKILVSVDTLIPVTAKVDESITLPFKTNLNVSLPFKTVLKVPIDHTFQVPIKGPLLIPLDHVFNINERVHLKTEIPLDTEVETKIFGIKRKLRAKGSFLLDQYIPVKHGFHFKDTVAVNTTHPFDVPIQHTFDVPVDILMEGTFPINEEITVPFKVNLKQGVLLSDKVPVTIEFDILFDLEKGLRIRQEWPSHYLNMDKDNPN
ncbi:MAG: hypothetical protein SWO11_05170 [Thermodesulfobacteriota bacterium]|nr:hypothetical protein [Thermodesulfobacteriota bacterium]